MRNAQRHWRRFLFLNLSIGIALLFVCLEISSPGKKTSAAVPLPSLSNATETVEETVTLSASDMKTWGVGYQWWSGPSAYCGPPFHMFPPLEDIAGSVVAGYEHYYDKGTLPFPCPDGASAVNRGTVRFDLTGIISKAPPLHVSVKSALLHFRKDRECPSEELLIAQENWLKEGYPDKSLVSGDPFAKIPACAPSECVLDVTTVVNNWVRGEDHGGYANYGFLFKGPIEEDLHYDNNDVCLTRYSDFSLTVTYKYDKTAVIYVPAPNRPPLPGGPDILSTRMNVALASNGGKASASSTYAGYSTGATIDGDRKGLNAASGGGVWHSATGTNNDWLQVDFGGSKTINEIDVFTLQDSYTSPIEPTLAMTFTKYGLTGFEVQWWNGSAWVDVKDGNVTGNDKVWRQFTLPALATTKIRVQVNKTVDGFSRITELEAWSK